MCFRSSTVHGAGMLAARPTHLEGLGHAQNGIGGGLQREGSSRALRTLSEEGLAGGSSEH